MDQAYQQRQPLGSYEVPQVGRMQRSGFLGQMGDLGQADTLDQAPCGAQGLQPDQAAEPLIQVCERRTFRSLFDAMEVGQKRPLLWLKKAGKRLLFRFRESI